MRDHAPVTETPNTGTPEAFTARRSAASGNLAGGPDRSPAFLFPHPARPLGSIRAGEGRERETFCPPRQVLLTFRNSRRKLIFEAVGHFISVACLFGMLFIALFFGGLQ